MRIVHTEASCGWGGQEIRILEESKGMIERGHDVKILCPVEARIFAEAARWKVPVEAVPIGRKNLRGLASMRSWLMRHPVEVLNTHSSTDTWLAALACATMKASPPIVRTRHISAPIPDNAPTRWLYTKATRHIVTTGEALRGELIEANGYPAERITSVPTGIDPARFVPGAKDEARAALGLRSDVHYIGIVATLRSWKGHLYLLDAVKRLALPDWHLLIVGDGPMRGNIEARISELGLQQQVTLVGQVSNPEDWLRALDIFCLPSYANEGVPQAVLQAMFCALPVVTTTAGAICEAVADAESGLIVPVRDSDALTDALRRLANDTALATRLSAEARRRALHGFTLNAMLDRMEKVFQSVIV